MVAIKKGLLSKEALDGPFDYEVQQAQLSTGTAETIDIFTRDEETTGVFDQMRKGNYLLGDICYLRQCIKTGDDKTFVKEFDKAPGEPWKPTLKGRTIDRYGAAKSNIYLKYGPWLARNWNNKSFYETEKILVRETGSRLTATLDTGSHYVLSSLYGIYLRNESTAFSHKFLLGLLNSELATYFIKKTAFELTEGAFTKFRTNQLAKFPIPKLNLETAADKKKHDEVVGLVDQLLAGYAGLAAHKLAAAKEQAQARLRHLERRLDGLVYDLYQLTEEEKAHVAGGAAR